MNKKMPETRLSRLCALHSQQGGTIFEFERHYSKILDLSDEAFERRFGKGPKQWVFNWVNGGYNAVMASTKREALEIAHLICDLVPSPDTFRVVESDEMNRIDAMNNQD